MFLNVFKKYFLPFLPFLIVFITSINQPFDSDLGWHLKYGEYFFQNGKILRDNTFSQMMPEFHWANHSWGTDLLTYFVYSHFSFFGISILGALIIVFTFYFFAKAFDLSIWQKSLIFPLMLYFMDPVNSVSFRSQLFSYLFTGILLLILINYMKNNSKIIFLTIPLFILWANIHGGFILGLIIFFIWITFYIGEKIFFDGNKGKSIPLEELRVLMPVFIFSCFSTLINPFGINIYREIIDRVNNPWRIYIAEWSPFVDLSTLWWNQIIISGLILFGLLFLFITGKIKQNILIIAISIIIFIMSFLERRYAWTAYYLIIIFIKPITDYFKPNTLKHTLWTSFVINLILLSAIIYLKMPFEKYKNMSWNEYCVVFNQCSPKALEFLTSRNYKDQIFTPYNWGGWMIWNYPQIKPLIDGRMHLWKDDKSYSAFGEYYPLEQDMKDINKSKYNVVLMSNNKPLYEKLVKFSKTGEWKMIYKDKYCGIFVRNNSRRIKFKDS